MRHIIYIDWERPLTLLKLLIRFLSAQTYIILHLYTDLHPYAVAEKLRCIEHHFGIRLQPKRRPTVTFAVQNSTLCFYGTCKEWNSSTDRQTQSKRPLDNRTIQKNLSGPGLPAALSHLCVFSDSAHGIGRASISRARSEGRRTSMSASRTQRESSSLLFTHCMIQSPWQTLGVLEYESSASSHFCLEPAAYSTAFPLSLSLTV